MRFVKYLAIILIVALAFPAFLVARPPMAEYSRAIENSPEDVKYKFYLLRGKAYKDSGEMNFALNDLNNSIMLKPNRTAYIYRGEVYFEMERYAEAIDDFTTALNINPSLELYEMRGGSYLKSGSNVLALADGLNMINMASHNAESYYVSMEALENLGDIKLARELAFKVISLDRTNKKANELITKYPLKFVFIGEDLITIYVSSKDDATRDKANEILLKYKKGEKLDENLKNYLSECNNISKKIKRYQERIKEMWEAYFEEIILLKVRSRKVLEELRNKYLEKVETIEHEMAAWEKESEKCTEGLIRAYQRSKI